MWTIFGWSCATRGRACLTEHRCVPHHMCGVWVWLWVSELIGGCESLSVACVVCPCVVGSISGHVCVRVDHPVSCGVWVWPSVGVYYTAQTVVCDKTYCVPVVCVFIHVDARLFLALPRDTPQSLLRLRREVGEPPLCPRATPAPPRPAQPSPPPEGIDSLRASKQEPQSKEQSRLRTCKPQWLPFVCCEVGDPGQEAG